MNNQLFVSKYLLELPQKEQLEAFIQKELQNWLDSERPVFFINNQGYIEKNNVTPETNRIYTENRIPFNQPQNFNKFLDNYFKYRLN